MGKLNLMAGELHNYLKAEVLSNLLAFNSTFRGDFLTEVAVSALFSMGRDFIPENALSDVHFPDICLLINRSHCAADFPSKVRSPQLVSVANFIRHWV